LNPKAIEEVNLLPTIPYLKKTFEIEKIRVSRIETDFKQQFAIMLTKIANLSGIKAEIDELNAKDITKMILSKFNGLSIPEIYKSFELERYGEYGKKTDHFQLFNAEYVSAILIKYKEWKITQLKANNIPLVIEEKKEDLSEEEKKEIMSNAIINKFLSYKETGEIEEPFAHVLEELVERNLIRVTNNLKVIEYYHWAYDQAREQLTKEYAEARSANPTERTQIKQELVKIMNSDSPKIRLRQMRIVLGDFFNKHIRLETDFETLIKN
jgi:hypothetical protein